MLVREEEKLSVCSEVYYNIQIKETMTLTQPNEALHPTHTYALFMFKAIITCETMKTLHFFTTLNVCP